MFSIDSKVKRRYEKRNSKKNNEHLSESSSEDSFIEETKNQTILPKKSIKLTISKD